MTHCLPDVVRRAFLAVGVLLLMAPAVCVGEPSATGIAIELNVAVTMRDGVVLRANVYRPERGGPFPVLVFRTPYGKDDASESYKTHLHAVGRGYAVVLQDVRGRYASGGRFDPYRQEGADGYDTIEWAAKQSWSNGKVGTFGLSYPGAVQWLAAVEAPPHLVAMVPAMTFSSPRNFFYMNGVFDRSWLPWIYGNVAPDARRRLGMPEEIAAGKDSSWTAVADEYRNWLPLKDLPYLRREAPFYFEWLAHPPEDPWWNWAELRGRYGQVTAAVLNLSGWYDDAYGPEGAITNFNGLVQARGNARDARTNLILGPWVHGVSTTAARQTGDLDFGPAAAIDYDDVILDFFDHHVRGLENEFSAASPVRHFVMGANEWRDDSTWPPADAKWEPLYLGAAAGGSSRRLQFEQPVGGAESSAFVADPRDPVTDPHAEPGPYDNRELVKRADMLTFDTEPLTEEIQVSGNIVALIYAECNCRDFDLWVRLLDVYPDGRAMNLMSPGNDVLRASYRDPDAGRVALEPGRVYELRIPALPTSIRFGKGHRLRAQISASFAPHLSRNLQTGESEVDGSESRIARITIHHDGDHATRLLLPVVN